MPRLVEQLQHDTMDPQVSVATLLRKVKFTATKLKLGQVESWVSSELNGYNDGDVPEYRKLVGQPKALNPYHGWIPLQGNPQLIDIFSEREIRQSVSEIENLLSSKERTLYILYSPKQVEMIHEFTEVKFAQYGVFFDKSAYVGILDSVRNAILDWALELEKAGIMGSDTGFSDEERKRAGGHTIQIGTFQGNLNAGDLIGAGSKVEQGDQIGNSIHHSPIFDQLDELIGSKIKAKADREELLSLAQELRGTAGTSNFKNAYMKFIASAATYMTILGPIIPELTKYIT